MARRYEAVLVDTRYDGPTDDPYYSIRAVATEEVPSDRGQAGSVEVVWKVYAGMSGTYNSKRRALREARDFAKRHGCPVYVQEGRVEETEP